MGGRRGDGRRHSLRYALCQTRPQPKNLLTMSGNGEKLIQPWDESNQQLVANVHPLDWKNPAPAARYNLGVIGAGTAGLGTGAGGAAAGAGGGRWGRNTAA